MNPTQCYLIYNAVHLHFTSDSYDCFKYNFKTRANEKSFYKRKDKYFFSKIGDKYSKNILDFFCAQYSDGDTNKWVGDMSEETYFEWKKRNESLSYYFEQDIKHLKSLTDSFDDLFVVGETYPPIIEEYLNKNINPETVCVLHSLTGFIDRINILDPLLYPRVKSFIIKYTPFIKYDKSKIQKIIFKYYEY